MADASGVAHLKMIVETEDGLFIRVIRGAMPLAPGPSQGRSAEDATQSSAATWGLPDFVFHAELDPKGSGNRELGDVLLVVGTRAAVVQVKSRTSPSGDESRERAWIEKAITKATRQAVGVVGRLRRSPATLTNHRGREHVVDGAATWWVGVVIIDHDSPPADFIPVLPSDLGFPVAVLLRRDWEFLFDQLRSADAVLAYLLRVGDLDPIPLGNEPLRYYELADADEDAPPGALPAGTEALGARLASVPVLPKTPAGRDDGEAHAVLRMILEGIATVQLDRWDENTRLTVLAEIDGLPVATRTELGRRLLWMIDHVSQVEGDQVRWAFRRFFWSIDVPFLLFGACSRYDEKTALAFGSLAQFRHYELGQAFGTFDGLITVGVMLTPRHDDLLPWDTSVVRITGEVEYDPEALDTLRRVWGDSRDHASGEVWTPDVGDA